MGIQFIKSSLIPFLLAFAPAICKAQDYELPSRMMNICINGVAVSNNPSFVESIGYKFKNSRYESDDLDQVDAVIYFKSDSMDISFYEYKGVTELIRIHIKCKSCIYDCEGRNVVSLGDSVSKIRQLNETEFDKYAMTYYTEISNRESVYEIPGMIIPFSFQFPGMPHSQAGQINMRFENKMVRELFILFYPD